MRLQPPGLNPKMEVLMELNPINIPSATEYFRKGLKFNFKYQSISAKKEEKCSLYLLLFAIPYKKKAHLQEKCRMWISFLDLHCTCCPFSQETAPKPFEGTSVISSGLVHQTSNTYPQRFVVPKY